MVGYRRLNSLHPKNKRGGLPISEKVSTKFSSFLNDCGLVELESKGPAFTWEGKGVVEKLDWAFCNDTCKILFPNSFVDHLVERNSDHQPILVSLHSDIMNPIKPFSF